VFDSLQSSGFFADPQRRAVESTFLPWIMAEVTSRLGQLQSNQDMLDNTILASLAQIRDEWPAPKPRAVKKVLPPPPVPLTPMSEDPIGALWAVLDSSEASVVWRGAASKLFAFPGFKKTAGVEALLVVDDADEGVVSVTFEEFRLQMIKVLQAGGASPALDAQGVWAQLDVEEAGEIPVSAVLAGVQRGLLACVPGWASAKGAAIAAMLGEEEEVSQEAFLEGMKEVLGEIITTAPPPEKAE
jgi:hypothetical protein